MKSYCGMDCEKCVEYPHICQGCSIVEGKPPWAVDFPGCLCPMYTCCMTNGFSGCEECRELVCDIKETLSAEE